MPAVGDALGDTCHIIGRKKRRGLIEKRRRDRINNSLNELRRLVPAAFEKQGSAKLEKAEILQMTVDHLTMLHAKGFDAFSFDPHKFAMDYHGIGFRECMSEIIRYLGTEGLDSQDPLRARIMNHLQCYASQREMALKSSAAVSSWNPSAFTTPMHQFTVPAVPPPPPNLPSATSTLTTAHHQHLNSPSMSNELLVSSSSSTATWSGGSSNNSSDHMIPSSSQMSNEHLMPPPLSIFKSSGSPVASPVSSTASSPSVSSGNSNSGSSIPPHSYCYSMAPTTAQYFPTAASYPHHHHHHHHPASAAAAAASVGQQAASVKHYRPWGAELAY